MMLYAVAGGLIGIGLTILIALLAAWLFLRSS
jgi:hypothetical protein